MNITPADNADPMTSSGSGCSVNSSRIATPTAISSHTVAA